MEDVRAILKSLGARKSEIKVYMDLVGKGEAGVREIIERTGLSEKTVRVALKGLERKGLVRRERRGKKVVYRAVSLRTLFTKFKESLQKRLSELFRH